MEDFTIVIKPKEKLFAVDFKEMWRYRDLFTLFVKRNITTQFKQTILGPLWFIIQPTFTTIVYTFIFGGIAKMSTDGLPQSLFYLSGIVLWQYFSDCLGTSSGTFSGNAGLFGKVYFPRLIMPLTRITSNLLKLGIQLVMFVCIYIYYLHQGANIAPNIYILLTPVLILMLAMLALGVGIIVSSMTTKYRDLALLFGFVVSLWMYCTPIIYPISSIGNEKLRFIMSINPLTSIFEVFKYSTMGVGTFHAGQLLYSAAVIFVVLVIGILMFNKIQRKFMDTV